MFMLSYVLYLWASAQDRRLYFTHLSLMALDDLLCTQLNYWVYKVQAGSSKPLKLFGPWQWLMTWGHSEMCFFVSNQRSYNVWKPADVPPVWVHLRQKKHVSLPLCRGCSNFSHMVVGAFSVLHFVTKRVRRSSCVELSLALVASGYRGPFGLNNVNNYELSLWLWHRRIW